MFKAPKVNTKPQNYYYQQIWREAQSANGTLVEDYLSSRGINLTVPKTIRFHSSLYHAPSKQFFPCMVGASTIKKWETGEKHPTGPALKLLNLIADKGLSILV